MRPVAVLVSLASLLLGLGFGAVITQNPDWAPVAIGSAVAIYAAAGVLSLPSARRAIPFLRTKEDKDDLLRVFLAASLTAAMEFPDLIWNVKSGEEFTAITRRVERWTSDTSLELDQLRPGWGALFRSDPIALGYGAGAGRHHLVRRLSQREAALRDLMKLLP